MHLGKLFESSDVRYYTDDEEAGYDPLVPNITAWLEHERFPNLVTFSPAIDDFVKESKKVGQINPESAVETSSVDPAVDEGIVALDHHKPSALEALHTCPSLYPDAEKDHQRRSRIAQRLNVRQIRSASSFSAPLLDGLFAYLAWLFPVVSHTLNVRDGNRSQRGGSAACYVIEYDS